MHARDLMTGEPAFSLPDESLHQVAREMRDLDVGFIPVVEDPDSMKLAGVITDRDMVVRHVADECQGCSVKDHMTTDGLVAVNPDTEHDFITSAMKEARVRRIAVIDDDERLLGVIAQADVARELGDRKPEEVEEVLEAVSA